MLHGVLVVFVLCVRKFIWPLDSPTVQGNNIPFLLAITPKMPQALSCLATIVTISAFVTLCLSSLSTSASSEHVASNSSLLWGPYRPNLYFGVRPRIPKSLLAGLMWAKVNHVASVQNSESALRLQVKNMFLHAKDFLFRVADTFRLQAYLRTK
jgi:Glycosyl hydrolase family 63 N-terminal domain